MDAETCKIEFDIKKLSDFNRCRNFLFLLNFLIYLRIYFGLVKWKSILCFIWNLWKIKVNLFLFFFKIFNFSQSYWWKYLLQANMWNDTQAFSITYQIIRIFEAYFNQFGNSFTTSIIIFIALLQEIIVHYEVKLYD